VALPQYSKSVNKSRAAQALPVIKSLMQAVEVYFMANGTAPESLEELAKETGGKKSFFKELFS